MMEESRLTDEPLPIPDEPSPVSDETPPFDDEPSPVSDETPPFDDEPSPFDDEPSPADNADNAVSGESKPSDSDTPPFAPDTTRRPFAVAHGVTGYGAAQEPFDPFLSGFNAEYSR